MTLDDFRSLPELASAFPLVHRNGARWTSMEALCGGCSRPFPSPALRGAVSEFGPGPVFVVDAVGHCPGCRLLTPVRYRVYPDRSMVGESPRTGEWSRWAGRPSLLSRLRRWLLG